MGLFFSFCMALSTYLSISNSQWIESNSTLSTATYGHALGFYNKSILLLGGDANQNQLIQYDITHDTFIDLGNTLVVNVYGWVQFYTQIRNTLYMNHHSLNQISSFDLKTQIFTESFINNIPTNPGHFACVTSTNIALFVIGGRPNSIYLNSVQMYDLLNNTWLNNIPLMNENRGWHSCIIHPQNSLLYAIGGAFLSSIETISTDNILQQKWSYISDSLSQPLIYTRSVVYKHMILIIGGSYRANNEWNDVDTIHILNTLTDEVSVSSDALYMALSDVASVIVDDIWYVFGGWIFKTDIAVDTVFMYDLANAFPNTEPTTTSDTITNAITTVSSTTVHSTEDAISSIYSTFYPSADTLLSQSISTTVTTPTETETTETFNSTATNVSILAIDSTLTTKSLTFLSKHTMILSRNINNNNKSKHTNNVVIYVTVTAIILGALLIVSILVLMIVCFVYFNSKRKKRLKDDVIQMSRANQHSEIKDKNVVIVLEKQKQTNNNSEFPMTIEGEEERIEEVMTIEGEEERITDDKRIDTMNNINDEYQNNPNIDNNEFIIEAESDDETAGDYVQ